MACCNDIGFVRDERAAIELLGLSEESVGPGLRVGGGGEALFDCDAGVGVWLGDGVEEPEFDAAWDNWGNWEAAAIGKSKLSELSSLLSSSIGGGTIGDIVATLCYNLKKRRYKTSTIKNTCWIETSRNSVKLRYIFWGKTTDVWGGQEGY